MVDVQLNINDKVMSHVQTQTQTHLEKDVYQITSNIIYTCSILSISFNKYKFDHGLNINIHYKIVKSRELLPMHISYGGK